MTDTTTVLTTVIAPALWGTALATGVFALDQAGFFGRTDVAPNAQPQAIAAVEIAPTEQVADTTDAPLIEVTRAATASILSIPQIERASVKSAPAMDMQAVLFDALSQAVPAAPTASRPAPIQSTPVIEAETVEADLALSPAHGHGDDMVLASANAALAPCVAELQTVASRTRVYFDSNSAVVAGQARQSAYSLALMVSDCPQARVEIVGFSDPKGNEDDNVTLSWNRANATLEALRVGGFDTSPYNVTSHMAIHPDYCTHYDVVDRRVEFTITQGF